MVIFISEETNQLFAFTDAIDALKELLEKERDERDSFGPKKSGPHAGLYVSWDQYHAAQRRVEVMEDILEAFATEERVADLIHDYGKRA